MSELVEFNRLSAQFEDQIGVPVSTLVDKHFANQKEVSANLRQSYANYLLMSLLTHAKLPPFDEQNVYCLTPQNSIKAEKDLTMLIPASAKFFHHSNVTAGRNMTTDMSLFVTGDSSIANDIIANRPHLTLHLGPSVKIRGKIRGFTKVYRYRSDDDVRIAMTKA